MRAIDKDKTPSINITPVTEHRLFQHSSKINAEVKCFHLGTMAELVYVKSYLKVIILSTNFIVDIKSYIEIIKIRHSHRKNVSVNSTA